MEEEVENYCLDQYFPGMEQEYGLSPDDELLLDAEEQLQIELWLDAASIQVEQER
jgi:hypothetical protein